MSIELIQLVKDFGEALALIDKKGVRFKEFQPGIGPHGEPQLVKLVVDHLACLPDYVGKTLTRRTPTCSSEESGQLK